MSRHFHDLELGFYPQFNQQLYRTVPAEIEQLWSGLSASAQQDPDHIVHFVIAFMRLGLFNRAQEVSGKHLFADVVHDINLDDCLALLSRINIKNYAKTEDFSILLEDEQLGRLVQRLAHYPTATLHANWYIFAWYEYLSAINLALVLLFRAVQEQDQNSLGRCLSYLGLACSLVGFYDLGDVFATCGLNLTSHNPETAFRKHWIAEAQAIKVTSSFYCDNHSAAIEIGAKVSTGPSRPDEFPFAHIYTDTSVMRAALDGFRHDAFIEAKDRLQRLLGKQFDTRYIVQSHYCSAIFLFATGQEQKALKHFALARNENLKASNRFRSINASHCLTYEARFLFLLGYHAEAIEKCQQAIATLPKGSTDGRHALEVYLLLWRIIIFTKAKLPKASVPDGNIGAWEEIARNTIDQLTRNGVAARNRFEIHKKMSTDIANMSMGQALDFFVSRRAQIPTECADFACLVTRMSQTHFVPIASLDQLADSLHNLSYVEELNSFLQDLEKVSDIGDSVTELLIEKFGQLTQKLCHASGSIEIKSIEENSDVQTFSSLAPGFWLDGEVGTLTARLHVNVNTSHGSRIVTVSQIATDIRFHRYIVDALLLARASLEAFIRSKELTKQREHDSHFAAVAETIAALAHDVRAPFSTLNALLKILPSVKDDKAYLDMALESVQRKVKSVDELVMEILEATKPLTLQPQMTNVENLVKDALEFAYSGLTLPTDHQVVVSLASAYNLRVDPPKLRRVLGNILLNAAQIAKQTATITVSSRDLPNNVVEISIHNTGSKLSDEDSSKLFKTFFSKRRGGTGLGLAIAHKIVTAHGGKISAMNQNNGVAFIIQLPAQAGENASATKMSFPISYFRNQWASAPEVGTKVSHIIDHTKATILLVDDDHVYRSYLMKLLGGMERQLVKASSYQDALSILTTHKNLTHFICDIDLGDDDGDGIDLLAAAVKQQPSIMAALHSNRAFDHFSHRLPPHLHYAYFPKPASVEQLKTFLGSKPMLSKAPVAQGLFQ